MEIGNHVGGDDLDCAGAVTLLQHCACACSFTLGTRQTQRHVAYPPHLHSMRGRIMRHLRDLDLAAFTVAIKRIAAEAD